jgi:hypothetical protein
VISGQASRGRESAGVPFGVAWAFQPEICPLRPGLMQRRRIGVKGALQTDGFTRSREAAKGNAVGSGQWSVFGFRFWVFGFGELRTGVCGGDSRGLWGALR